MMIFLKLGGSLITEKAGHEVAKIEVIRRLALEIAEAYNNSAGFKLLLGHGSGSFGHRAAAQYATHKGSQSVEDWRGFVEVAAAANRLHRIVIDLMREADLPVISFPPSSMLLANDGQILSYALDPIALSLKHNLIPVVHGDVAFDTRLGTTIVSTEQIMAYLAEPLGPSRLLLAGKESGILTESGEILKTFDGRAAKTFQFHEPEGADVTGGMRSKVDQAINLATRFPELEVLIFGAEAPGVLRDVLMGGTAGTRIIP